MSDEEPDTTDPFARARGEVLPTVELAEQIAKALAEPYSHQMGVCGRLGLNFRTYKRWLSEDCPEHARDFKRIVLAALEQKRIEDLQRGEAVLGDAHPAKATSYFNMWKFQHESRFKRFYQDDQPTKVELTGKDGGPIEHDLRGKGVDELVALMLGADAVKRGREDGEDE